jgi:hypothetical protein
MKIIVWEEKLVGYLMSNIGLGPIVVSTRWCLSTKVCE